MSEYGFQLFTLRDETADRLIQAGVAGGNVSKSRIMPFAQGELKDPVCLVFVRGSSMEGAGKYRPPQFSENTQIIIQIALRGDSGVDLEQKLEAEALKALSALLLNQAWLELSEEVSQIELQYDTPEQGAGYEGHALLAITVAYQTIWEKGAVDNLLKVYGETPEYGIDIDPDEPGTDVSFSVDLEGAD